MQDANKQVWKPWWGQYLAKCDDLIRAAKENDYNAVARLIDYNYGADMAVNVNFQEHGTGYTALHYAVNHLDVKLVNLLVKNYADIKA